MSRGAVSTWALLAVTQLGLAWRLGFSPADSFAFWLLSALLIVGVWRLTRSLFGWSGRADAITRAGTLGFAAIVAMGLTLGSVGLLTFGVWLAASALGCATSFVVLRPRRDAVGAPPPLVPLTIAASAIPLLAFIVAVGLVQSPFTLYDSLSYHLPFSARWLLDHRLSIVRTPFSDPAQAYQPANGELWFLWLMLPFHGDFAARLGQLPFLLLGAVALYAIARRCGARPTHAMYAPLFFLLARPVVEQGVGADVDLICAAMFVASIHLGIVAIESGARRDWALWGVCVGLFLGTKYVALVYVAVLLLLPLLRGSPRQARWAVPGIAVFGLPWYLRNWAVAGSPIYPASLALRGFTIAHGAYTRAAMTNSVFHVTSVRLLPAIVAHAFGAAAFLFWLPMAALATAALVKRRRWHPALYVWLAPMVMLPLFWFGIPDNADSRFLLPAVTLGMVPLTFTFGSARRWNALLHTCYVAGAAWLIVGSPRQIPMTLPWFMGDWLALRGLVSREGMPLFAGAATVTAAAAYAASRRPAHAAPLLMAAFCGCVVWSFAAAAPFAAQDASLLALSPTYVRVGMIDGWTWVHRHLAHATIANTGNNLPYPLFGEHLANRVYYVNIDRHADWQFHDYATVRRRVKIAAYDRLAQPSGQLMPVAREAEAARPRYERWEGTPDAWLGNLRAAQVTHLFVSVLSAYEIDDVRHNDGGFPVEDDWARARPQVFALLYENRQVRIYAVAHQ
ncbi:MAG: hypothetical protein JWL71_3091 [Acidobacteria bacterium]|nr:hypothetical protein [Acidobacteriota bacterium]